MKAEPLPIESKTKSCEVPLAKTMPLIEVGGWNNVPTTDPTPVKLVKLNTGAVGPP